MSKKTKIGALVCVAVLLLAVLSIQFGNTRNDSNYIDEAVSYYKPQGTEIVLIKNGEIDQTLCYGYANVEEKTKVTEDTQFKIASISKVFTSYAIMQLVDAGKLNLDAPINSYLTQWQVPASEYDANKVTLRTLLCHTSGLSGSDATGYIDENIGVAATLEKDKVHMLREPGTEFVYLEATGLGICQLVIEETTGMSFADYMQKNIFDKLGMTQTSFEDSTSALATPYAGLNQPIEVTHYVLTGASGITTTGTDMARFIVELMRYQQTGAEMFTPQDLADGAWCLGITPKTLSGGKMIYEHNGTLTGWNAQIAISPDTGDGLIVLSNSDKAYYMTYQMMEDWGRYALGAAIIDENITGMSQSVKTILLGFAAVLFVLIAWNYYLTKCGTLVEKDARKRKISYMISGLVMIFAMGFYGVLFYMPIIFDILYQQPNYYLFSFFPPFIHWLAAELLVLSAVVVWRSGYRRKKMQEKKVSTKGESFSVR
ncbi:MAG: serine hydrolase domain-containing protein [bacterium]|nr:serine hydrolase domain-containing protein [bacterium]